MDMNINLRVKEVRLLNKMNKKEFSSFINIDNSQYTKIEQGKISPTLSQLVEISSKFRISLNWLIAGEGEKLMAKEEGDIKPYVQPENPNDGISERHGDYITKYAYLEKQLKEMENHVESLKEMLKEKQLIINEKDAIIHEKNQIIDALKPDNKTR